MTSLHAVVRGSSFLLRPRLLFPYITDSAASSYSPAGLGVGKARPCTLLDLRTYIPDLGAAKHSLFTQPRATSTAPGAADSSLDLVLPAHSVETVTAHGYSEILTFQSQILKSPFSKAQSTLGTCLEGRLWESQEGKEVGREMAQPELDGGGQGRTWSFILLPHWQR